MGKLRAFGLTLVAILFATTPAFADPISLTVLLANALLAVGVGEATAAAIAIFLTSSFVIDAVISFGLSYLAKALSGGGNKNTSTSSTSDGPGQTIQAGGALPRSFIVGSYETPGKLIYANTYGVVDQTPNAYLKMVVALSDLPDVALQAVWVSNVKGTYGSGSPDSNLGYAIPEFNNGTDNLWVKFYNGHQAVADPHLVSLFSSDSTYPYTSARVGVGVAYAVVTIKDEPKLFTSVPSFKFELHGIPLYDPRLDTTAGGSGSQRFNDQTTWVYSENPAVVVYNILRGITYGGEWVYGLQNMDASRLPTTSWFAAMNECDASVDNNTGGTEVQFRCGAEITVDVQPADVMVELLKACNGRLAEVGGIYKMAVGAVGSSVFSFSDDDIITTEQQSYIPFPTESQRLNALTATYPAPDQAWAKTSTPPRFNPTLETLDGRRYITNVDYNTVPYLEQVQRLMTSAILEARKYRKHILYLPPQAWVLEPNDIVTYTSTRNGYSSKLFRVDQVTDNNNLDVVVALTECDPADYDWDPTTQYLDRLDGPLSIGVLPPSQAIVDWAVSAITVFGDGGRSKAGIQLAWATTGITDVIGVQFRVRLHSDQSLIMEGHSSNWTTGNTVISGDLSSDTIYDVQGRYIAGSARDTEWSDWLTVTTDDVKIPGVDLSFLAVDYDNLSARLQDFQQILAGFQREVSDEISLLTNGISQSTIGGWSDRQYILTQLTSTTGSITAAYTNAILVATGPGSALVQSITQLTATLIGFDSSNTVATALTSLTATVTSQGTTITANSSSITDLSATIGGTYSSSNTVATALSGLSVSVTQNGTDISTNAASIVALSSTIGGTYNSSNTIATAISGLNTSVSSINGSVTALSSAITSTQADVGRLSASGYFIISSQAAPAGASSRIALSVSASSGGSATTASLFLDALSGGTSRVVVNAAEFYITDNTTNTAPFFYSSGTLFMTNVVIQNLDAGNITTGSLSSSRITTGFINGQNLIADNVLYTGHLQSNSVTNASVASGGTTAISLNSWTTVASITVTTVGGDILVSCTDYWTWSSNGPRGQLQIIRDGSVLIAYEGVGGGSCPDFLIMAATGLDTSAGAGSHTYDFQQQYNAGNQPTSQSPYLVITELKR